MGVAVVVRGQAHDEVEVATRQFLATPRHDLAGVATSLRALIERLEGVWLNSLLDLEESGVREESGAASLAAWLRRDTHLAPGEARRTVALAEALDGPLAVTANALSRGEIRVRHAQVIAETVGCVPEPQRAAVERLLVPPAKQVDPMALRRLGQHAVYSVDPDAADAAALARYERGGLHIAETFGGMVALQGVLDPIGGATVLTALEALAGPARRAQGPSRTAAQYRADALTQVCQAFLDQGGVTAAADPGDDVSGTGAGGSRTTGGSRVQVSVIVDIATLRGDPAHPMGELDWTGPITGEQARLLACDAGISRVITDGPSRVLDVGRTTRTIPAALRRAVIARDRGCIGPGCTMPAWWCDVHHITFWEHGGETSLDNLALVCRHHHHDIHLGGWQVTSQDNGAKHLHPPPRRTAAQIALTARARGPTSQ